MPSITRVGRSCGLPPRVPSTSYGFRDFIDATKGDLVRPTEYPTGHYLEEALQLHVPAYQRPYSWADDRLIDLWRDVASQYRSAAAKGLAKQHFMGALILERNDEQSTTGVTAVSVIDGQQRLLTLMVLLAAIRDQIYMGNRKKVPPKNELFEIKPKFGGATAKRVLPKAQDVAAMDAILRGRFLSEIEDDLYDHALSQAYRFFRYQLWLGKKTVSQHTLNLPPRPKRDKAAPPRGSFVPWGKSATPRNALDLPMLHGVITSSLTLLELMIEERDEEAGVIFETMNAKSTPLRQFDLLRNSIFVRMPKAKDDFYSEVWQHVETTLDGVSYASLRDKPQDQFFYEYVICTGEAGVSKDVLHRRWLSGVIEDLGYGVTPQSEKKIKTKYVDPLAQAAFLYPLAVGQKKSVRAYPSRKWIGVNDEVHVLISEIMAMSGGPLVPLILKALIDRENKALDDVEVVKVLTHLQSYLVRLMLAGEDFSPLRATMMGVASRLPSPATIKDYEDALKASDWKTDAEVLAGVLEMNTKKWSSKSFFPVLRGIERQLSGISAHPLAFGSSASNYSVEHIYPQTPNIGRQWEADLLSWGVSRDDIDARRYVLGNLTAATGYDNKRNGKKRLSDKQTLIRATARLKLHESFLSAPKWTPARIDKRTIALATAALNRWPRA